MCRYDLGRSTVLGKGGLSGTVSARPSRMRSRGPSTLRKIGTSTVIALVFAGCAADNGDGEEVASETSAIRKKDVEESLRRVALGRLFQHEEWVVKAAGEDADKRVTYACKAFARLEPTYVSGLVRLDGDEKIRPEIVDAYKGVRDCVRRETKRKVKVDIVLNARHYGSADAIRTRLKEVKDAFDPDVVFFDFFADPWNEREWEKNRGAMTAGIEWIHNHGMLAAGNVQLSDKDGRTPPGADFVAVKFGNNGFEGVSNQLEKIRDRVPVLMHIQNDPQIDGSAGLKWMSGTPGERRDLLDDHTARATKRGYEYMYPVFFPLKQVKRDDKPTVTIAYDAWEDGLLGRMESSIRKD